MKYYFLFTAQEIKVKWRISVLMKEMIYGYNSWNWKANRELSNDLPCSLIFTIIKPWFNQTMIEKTHKY